MVDTTKFQYCQKLVVFNPNMDKVLLARRKGEADFDGVYSFIGGKMETTDETILKGMYREKCEEIGFRNKVLIYPDLVHHEVFTKKSGDKMILPHYVCIFSEGEIDLNDEYTDYIWYDVNNILDAPNVIPTVPDIVGKFKGLEGILKELSRIELNDGL